MQIPTFSPKNLAFRRSKCRPSARRHLAGVVVEQEGGRGATGNSACQREPRAKKCKSFDLDKASRKTAGTHKTLPTFPLFFLYGVAKWLTPHWLRFHACLPMVERFNVSLDACTGQLHR